MKLFLTESEIDFLAPGIMYNNYCMEAVIPTHKRLKEIAKQSVMESLLEAKRDGNKGVRSNKFLDLINKVKKLPDRYRVESSNTKKLYNELKKYINKTKFIDKKMVSMAKAYFKSLKKDVNKKKAELDKKKKDIIKKSRSNRVKREDPLTAIALGLIILIAIMIAINIVIKAIMINLVVIATLIVSNVLHYAWGVLVFPIHTLLALTWNIIKRISNADDVETIRDLLKRLIAKYFQTKGVIARIADRFTKQKSLIKNKWRKNYYENPIN